MLFGWLELELDYMFPWWPHIFDFKNISGNSQRKNGFGSGMPGIHVTCIVSGSNIHPTVFYENTI